MNKKTEWTPGNLWVVAENQMGGRVACVSMDGYLQTYETQEEAEADAKSTIESLNEALLDSNDMGYAPDSWSGELLADVYIGEDQNHIIMPSKPPPMIIKISTMDEKCHWLVGRKTLTDPYHIEVISIEAWKQKFPEQRFD